MLAFSHSEKHINRLKEETSFWFMVRVLVVPDFCIALRLHGTLRWKPVADEV